MSDALWKDAPGGDLCCAGSVYDSLRAYLTPGQYSHCASVKQMDKSGERKVYVRYML